MIFWICIILVALGVIAVAIGNKKDCAAIAITGLIAIIYSGIAVGIMITIILNAHLKADAMVQGWQEQYKALTYKMESGACRDEFGLLSKEIIDEIQDWNTDLVFYKQIQRDFWVGIFYPNVFDEFETIDYERYAGKPQGN